MQLYFIRHGESTNNALYAQTNDYHGLRTTDPELTERGQRQATLLATHLTRPFGDLAFFEDYQNHHGFGLTHIYCSLMVRAIDTALPTATQLGLPLKTLPTIHEYGGIFEFEGTEKRIGHAGLKRSELLARYPDLQIEHEVAEAGWWNFRVEDSAELYRRAGEAIDYLLDNHSDNDRVAIISHGGFYQAFMAQVMRIEVKPPYPDHGRKLGFAINNTAITRVAFEGDRRAIVYSNRTTHLPSELVTR